MDEIKIPISKMINITDLKKHELNVKEHPDSQIQNLMNLIKMVGFKDPIVIDKNNIIWAGHGRLEAAFRLGMAQIPCIYLENLSDSQKKLFMYMDNLINESPWVMDNVKILLGDVPQIELDNFDVDFSSILGPEIKEDDEIPEPPVEPKSKLGDIYQLGDHRVMCGDSSEKSNVDKLIINSKIDCLQTDPPYGIDYSEKNDFLNKLDKGNRIQTPIKNDESIINFKEFMIDFLKLVPFAEYNAIYVWLSELKTVDVRQAFDCVGIKYSQTIIWVKNNHVLSRLDYHPKHEPCLYGWKGKHKFYGGYSKMSTQYFDKPLVNDLHPTMKPINLILELIINSTKKGMNVYDPFLGSGTTLIACESTNRICYGMELDPRYIDVILDRWSNFTEKDPVRISDGKKWSEIKKGK